MNIPYTIHPHVTQGLKKNVWSSIEISTIFNTTSMSLYSIAEYWRWYIFKIGNTSQYFPFFMIDFQMTNLCIGQNFCIPNVISCTMECQNPHQGMTDLMMENVSSTHECTVHFKKSIWKTLIILYTHLNALPTVQKKVKMKLMDIVYDNIVIKVGSITKKV